MSGDLSCPMKNTVPASVLTCVAVLPDQVQLDCPACAVTHILTRDLDFHEDPEGVWRMVERPGFECDCGVLILSDFRLTVERI